MLAGIGGAKISWVSLFQTKGRSLSRAFRKANGEMSRYSQASHASSINAKASVSSTMFSGAPLLLRSLLHLVRSRSRTREALAVVSLTRNFDQEFIEHALMIPRRSNRKQVPTRVDNRGVCQPAITVINNIAQISLAIGI